MVPPVTRTSASVVPSPPSTMGASRTVASGMARRMPCEIDLVTSVTERDSLKPEGATRMVMDMGGLLWMWEGWRGAATGSPEEAGEIAFELATGRAQVLPGAPKVA